MAYMELGQKPASRSIPDAVGGNESAGSSVFNRFTAVLPDARMFGAFQRAC
jgi:hypothetical protein